MANSEFEIEAAVREIGSVRTRIRNARGPGLLGIEGKTTITTLKIGTVKGLGGDLIHVGQGAEFHSEDVSIDSVEFAKSPEADIALGQLASIETLLRALMERPTDPSLRSRLKEAVEALGPTIVAALPTLIALASQIPH